jgi:L-ascorbate metabolism protein UlaG (beta-lactamase superfamily)
MQVALWSCFAWGAGVTMGLLSACQTRYPVSDHFDGEVFYNPDAPEMKGLGDFLKWQLTSKPEEWPEALPPSQARPAIVPNLAEGQVAITFVNHAGFLIQLPGLNILTDPIWSERVSPVSWAGPKRVCAPGIPFEQLPKIDMVLVSHNHYDHMDLPTLKRLVEVHRPTIVVPLGDKNWLEDEGITGVNEMDWWQVLKPTETISVLFTPAQHWSARGLFDRRKSLWGSYSIVYQNQVLYFAGDTGYGPHFQKTAARIPRVKVAMLPIGAYEPRWFMKQHHMNPAEAVQAHFDLKAEQSIGMHFGCWQLTDEGVEQPARDLKAARDQAQLKESKFIIPEVGATYRYEFD